ncbi:DNA ligase D [soil metagenome]
MATKAAATTKPLDKYNAKRDFKVTAEPAGKTRKRAGSKALSFVVQKHWASRLHYDFRLELDGVMLSWAVPKGPSFDPADKRMAIHVEDHPIDYSSFEGEIPKGQYGGGKVIVWDNGTWEPVGDPREGLKAGKLVFKLHGQKLAGLFELVNIPKKSDPKTINNWILFKKRGDAWARPAAEFDVITALPDSVVAKPLGLVEEREPREEPTAAAAATATAPDLSLAVMAPMPAKLEPQLATLASEVPAAGKWIVESKLDGYRVMARIDGDDVRLFTRNGHDWTDKLSSIAIEIRQLGIAAAFLDGEIVVINDHGVPDFNALQNAIDNSRSTRIDYFVFDVPFVAGRDLRRVPLQSRRIVLRELLTAHPSERVKFSESFDATPQQMLKAACEMGMEGVMVKRADAPYVSSRTDTWLKLKCSQRQEFIVVGFTDRANSKTEVGGLLLAYHEDGQLRFGGSVGTGWNSAKGQELHKALTKLRVEKPAVDATLVKPCRWSKRVSGTEKWVKPTMVVEVAFSEWTPDGHVRHPSFKGVRTDKAPNTITRERPAVPSTSAGSPAGKPSSSSGVKITNAERVIDTSTGFTKGQLVHYYESIAPFILPHLKDRPVALVRAPEGVAGEQFFQKHVEGTKMPGLKVLDPALWPGHSGLLSIDTADALIAAAQMNTVELHTWNSTSKNIDEPNRVIFDLDPGEGVTWKHLQEAAQLTHAFLEQIGLQSWLKTSGGKGLHVVVPLAPKLDFEIVKDWSQAVVNHIAKAIPQRFVAKSGGTNRVGKIFIDYLRNGHGQTTACAFSARVRPGLGVSMPVSWDQLGELKSGSQWNIATAREYLSFQKEDPWLLYWKNRQTLTKAMKAIGFSAR